jgi:hypothetical protein
MHTCLTLTNIGGRWYVEREVTRLLAQLRDYCDSIHSCDVGIEGPSGAGQAGCWRVELRVRVYDEIVRVSVRVPEGSDAQQALSRALADAYARARIQLNHISAQHGDCCAHNGQEEVRHVDACSCI